MDIIKFFQGVLLYGPPGTGKTLLARAVAHHTECTFIRVSGSELVQKFIGEGARMVRELFVMARYSNNNLINNYFKWLLIFALLATKLQKLLFQQIALKSIFRSTVEVILPDQVEDLIGCLYMYYV